MLRLRSDIEPRIKCIKGKNESQEAAKVCRSWLWCLRTIFNLTIQLYSMLNVPEGLYKINKDNSRNVDVFNEKLTFNSMPICYNLVEP